MFKASWLNEYTKTNDPKMARKNNTECAIREIENAYTHVTNTLAISAEDKNRIHKWMQQFREQ